MKKISWKRATATVVVGVSIIGALHFRRSMRAKERTRQQSDSAQPASTWSESSVALLQTIPTRVLSRCWGSMNEMTLPHWLRRPILGQYASMFECNMDEAEDPNFDNYNNLQEFFNRRLKPGARPFAAATVNSPADCRVLVCGKLDENGHVEQVKGVTYSVNALLDEDLPAPAEGNAYFHCVLYLAPGDYHHFHSPVKWTTEHLTHIPGDLLSVAPRVAEVVPGLFALNERVVLSGKWGDDNNSLFRFVAVGAYNVGSIVMEGNQKIHTNAANASMDPVVYPSYQTFIEKGDEVGRFRLGSTIILVFEAPTEAKFCISAGEKLKVGQAIM